MKIICDNEVITNAVNGVARAVNNKPVIPVLDGIFVKAQGSEVTLIGYDLSIAIKTVIQADVIEEGGIIIKANLFTEFLRSARQNVSIVTDDKNNVKIESGNAEVSFIGRSISEYPEIPEVTVKESISMDFKLFDEMVSQTVFATAVEDNNQVFKGVNFEFSENMVKLVGLDGKRLAVRKEQINNDKQLSFIVPSKTLVEAVRLNMDEVDNINITLDRHHVCFEAGSFIIVSRLIYGDYIKYEGFIPNESEIDIKVNVSDFLKANERVSMMITERVKSPVRISLKENTLNFRCVSEVGVATDSIICDNPENKRIVLGFNNRYMEEAMKATNCDEVKIEFISPIKPIKITPLEGDSFVFVVMPVQVEAEEQI